jgi:hypothetical protein
VEPAAVLVAALGVEIGGEVELGFGFEDGVPACAGLEPDVEDVHLLAELGAAAGTWQASFQLGQQALRRVDVPGVGASRLKRSTMLLLIGVVERLVALFAEEDGDGHAPDALAGDAPVGPGGDHVGDALFAPAGSQTTLLDLVEGALAEGGDVAVAVPGASIGVSMPMNHCSVARTMTGLWQRQQCG